MKNNKIMKKLALFLGTIVCLTIISANTIISSSSENSDISLKVLMSAAFADTESAQGNCEAAGGTYNMDEFTIPIPYDDDLILCIVDYRDCCVQNEI